MITVDQLVTVFCPYCGDGLDIHVRDAGPLSAKINYQRFGGGGVMESMHVSVDIPVTVGDTPQHTCPRAPWSG